MHARRARPDTRATDQRRLFAAVLSAVLPGLGQAFNRRGRPAAIFAIPSLVLLGIVWLLFQLNSSSMLVAQAIVPGTLQLLLIINGLVLAWRLIAVFEAFVDRRYPGKPGRLGGIGLIVVIAARRPASRRRPPLRRERLLDVRARVRRCRRRRDRRPR